MIQFFHVYKSYQEDAPTLMDVNCKIEKGDFISLTGPSGAGKTTLLKMIFCAEFPNEGQILVDGNNISRFRSGQIAALRRSIGVVFQDFKLIPNLNVYENIAVPLRILGYSNHRVAHRVDMILKLVGLEGRAKSFPMRLSGGEQQRIAIARSLVNDPKILLADEPTGNLDPSLTHEIVELFKEINLRGTTVLFATHDRNLLRAVRHKEMVLDNGKVIQL